MYDSYSNALLGNNELDTDSDATIIGTDLELQSQVRFKNDKVGVNLSTTDCIANSCENYLAERNNMYDQSFTDNVNLDIEAIMKKYMPEREVATDSKLPSIASKNDLVVISSDEDELPHIRVKSDSTLRQGKINDLKLTENTYLNEYFKQAYASPVSILSLEQDNERENAEMNEFSGKLFENKKCKVDVIKENKKLGKKTERMTANEEKKQQKDLKQALRAANKNMRPEECMKFVTIVIDTEIINDTYGAEVLTALQEGNVKYKLQPQTINNTIKWYRNLETCSLNERKLIKTPEIVEVSEVLLVMNWKQVVELIHNQSLLTHIKSIQSLIPNKRLSVAIYGLETYLRNQKKDQELRTRKKAKSQDVPKVSKNQIQSTLTELQILCLCSHRLIESPRDLSSMILQFTKSIAETPYKLEKQQKEEAEWYIAEDNKDCIRVDKNGNGLHRLWQQQLSAFPLANLEHANTIMTNYHTPLDLLEAYSKCTEDEGKKLLQDLPIRRAAGPLTTARKMGPELSKKIYTFFTTTDGNAVL